MACIVFTRLYTHLRKYIQLIRIKHIFIRQIIVMQRYQCVKIFGRSSWPFVVILRFIQLPGDYRIKVSELRVEPT